MVSLHGESDVAAAAKFPMRRAENHRLIRHECRRVRVIELRSFPGGPFHAVDLYLCRPLARLMLPLRSIAIDPQNVRSVDRRGDSNVAGVDVAGDGFRHAGSAGLKPRRILSSSLGTAALSIG